MIQYESRTAREAAKPALAGKPEFSLLPTLSSAFSVALQMLAVYVALRYVLVSLAPADSADSQPIYAVMGAIAYGVVAFIAYPRLMAGGAGITYEVPPETVLFVPGQRVRAVRPLFPVAKGALGTVTGKDVKKRHSKDGDRYFVTWDGAIGLVVKPGDIEKID